MGKVDIVEHPAEIAVSLIIRQLTVGQGLSFPQQPEIRGELARPQAGLMEALPACSPPIEHAGMLCWRVGRLGLIGQIEVRFDDIRDIYEQSSGALLPVF